MEKDENLSAVYTCRSADRKIELNRSSAEQDIQDKSRREKSFPVKTPHVAKLSGND